MKGAVRQTQIMLTVILKSGQYPTHNCVFCGDRQGQRSGIVTVVVGGVHLPNLLIDSGATCNLLGQGSWEWLKSRKIQWQTRKEAKALFPYGPYGNTKPLPTRNRRHYVH